MHSFLIYTNKKLNKYIDKYTHTYIPHGPQLLYPRVFPREMLTAVFKEYVSLGRLRSRCQNQSGCARDLLKKTSVRNRGKGPGKSRETLQTMTKIWHLWKEKREEHWGGRSSDHNAVWRKHKLVQWWEVSHGCPGILCVLGQAQQPCHAQSSVGNSPGAVLLGSDGCRGEATGRVNQLCSQPSLSRGGTATQEATQRMSFETLFVPAKNVNGLSGPLLER